MTYGEMIRVTGTVQGVGFRPTVWRLANACGIQGKVWNDAHGVMIEAQASQAVITSFIEQLHQSLPPLAIIDQITRTPIEGHVEPVDGFEVVTSRNGDMHTSVAADAATCPDCLAELLDPSNRRYQYPFTNCTHCGPRLSIIHSIPYDRVNTSMEKFKMCPECQAEYDNPVDRRFHAQPSACSVCGPKVFLQNRQGNTVESDDAIEAAAELIRDGRVVAIKGIGGIHLACDASNEGAVAALRQRKHRYHKALALMARDVEMVRQYAMVSAKEQTLLQDRAAPIVVLNKRGKDLAGSIAPGQSTLGFMLPYTPLHLLLMRTIDNPIVLTSGNRSDEPQTIDNQDAHQRLGEIADYFLLHDRDIVNRLDDSVVRVMDGEVRLLRRARGYAPQPISLPKAFASSLNILAMGGELKNTFCLIKDGKAIVSQHMGDLEDSATWRDYQHNLTLYQQLYDFKPDIVVVDKHPDYLSTQHGRKIAAEAGVPLIEVQHHHAHITSCMAEHGIEPDESVLGVALDGLGYGEDGTIWGGEFFRVNYQHHRRLAYFQPIPMIGGNKAMFEPWRNTLAHLTTTIGWDEVTWLYGDLEIIRYLQTQPVDILHTMMEKKINSPLASSAGRLFDAVAAALNICREHAGFEGQAAIELETAASEHFEAQRENGYVVQHQGSAINWITLWQGILDDLKQGTETGVIAARFHHCVARIIVLTATTLAAKEQLTTVALSGGVFQNRLLLEEVAAQIRSHGLRVIAPVKLPANDGGLSLGQAVYAAVVNAQ